MTGTLLKINGVWVTDPDPDSWSPVNCYEWTAGSGRVNTTGLFVGASKYYSISANASDYVPQGLVRLDGCEYYKSCTVTFAER